MLVVETPGAPTAVHAAAMEAAERGRLTVQRAEGLAGGLAAAAGCLNDVIVVAEALGDGSGVELVRAAARWDCDAPVIVVATGKRRETFREALGAGATDILVADEVTAALLQRAVRYAAERRRSQRAAQRGRSYLHALIRQSVDAILVTDRRGRLVYASPAFERLVGRAPGERLGYSVLTDLVPEQRRGAAAAWRALLRHPGRPLRGELRIRHAEGGERVVEVRGCNHLHDDFVRGVVLNAIDVTRWRELEAELLRRQRLFRARVEHGHDLITIVGSDGDVRFATPPVERLLGCTVSALVGTGLRERVHPEDAGLYDALLARARETPGTPSHAQVRLRHAAGGWRTFDTSATSLLHDGDVGGIVLNARDVTERAEVEAALRQSRQRLQQVEKVEAVGRLAGGVAHDFNNVITAIRGNAELLRGELTADGRGWEEVDEILDATGRATELTRQLLAFGRRQVLAPQLIDVAAVVADAERLLRRLLEENVTLETRLPPAAVRVRADPHQLGQVLMNLVVNARDAMPRGGRVVVSTRVADIGPASVPGVAEVVPGRYVLLEVTDEGSGMDRDTVEHAFEPFFSTKAPGEGTGLGLSTVYGIVKQSGGYVSIESGIGVGTVVTVYLPVALSPDGDPWSGGAGGDAVLVVSADGALRDAAVRALAPVEAAVLGAASAAEAVALSRQHGGALRLLVVDAALPEVDAGALGSRLGAERPELRVLLLASDDAAADGGGATPRDLVQRAMAVLAGGETAADPARLARASPPVPEPSRKRS